MSERKVLNKHYPPDFDWREICRPRGPKNAGPRVQTVRLMAPFSMKCLTCGEYIYKGRKFNARKTSPQDERYLGLQLHYFSIRCTRCSTEIVFRTDVKNNDYAMVSGGKRSMEPWRNREEQAETDEQRLDRLEREAAAEEATSADAPERNAMADLETQDEQSRREMAVADALDERRQRNARIERAEKDGVNFVDAIVREGEAEREREERELDELARSEFAAKRQMLLTLRDAGDDMVVIAEEADGVQTQEQTQARAQVPVQTPTQTTTTTTATVSRKKKKDYAGMLGIKIKK